MAVALANFGLPVDPIRQRVRFYLAGPGAEPHGTAEFLDTTEFTKLVDYAMGSGGIELARIGVFQTANISRKLNAGSLHPEANTEVRNFVLARIANRLQHTFNAAFAESTGNEN